MDRLEEYAKENNIPIMQKEGITFLKNYIQKNNIKTILEIGTAIGYSAINMALVNESIKVVSIERDKERYELAEENVNKFNLQDRITLIYKDALEAEIEGKFDLIFIDAAKAQYIKFFEKYKQNLNENGVIISDNLNFHGLTEGVEIKNRNLRALVRKINNYKDFLKENKEYTTEILNIGDGIGISTKI